MEELDLQFTRCLDAGRTLEEGGLEDSENVELETIRRYTLYFHRYNRLFSVREEANQIDRQLTAREAYVFQSQLLDYLHSKRGRVQPRKLANALAGLPTMNWRQSRTRCNDFPITAEKQFNYQIFEVILKLTKRLRSSLTDSSMDSISNVFKSLGNQGRAPMRFFRDHWRDFRLTIEEISKYHLSAGEVPFKVAARFRARANVPKSRAEQFLSESEQLKL